ncbi:MAG TPA: ABC transporter permease [Candidatus Saccharimonadales bacterium]|nr:ABC transporter permease [Candidatus Saccharimonadales bacterium]
MSLTYLFKFTLINIYQTKWRNLLGVSGLAVSVILLVYLISIGNGFNNLIVSQLNNPTAQKTITVTPGNTGMLKITQDQISSFKDYSGVEKIDEEIDFGGKLSFNGSTSDAMALAVEPDYFDQNSISLPKDVTLQATTAAEPQPIVVSNSLAKLFGFNKPSNFVGQAVLLDYTQTKATSKDLFENDVDSKVIQAKQFRVVAAIPGTNQPTVYFPYSIAVADGATFDSQITVSAANTDVVPGIRAKIESEGYTTSNVNDSINNVNSFFSFLNFLLFVIGLIGIVATTLGLLNLGAASFNSRIKEFAWLKVLGMKNFQIRLTLVFEQAILSFAATIGGILISIAFGLITNIIVKMMAQKNGYTYAAVYQTPIGATVALLLASLLFGVIVGLISSRNIYATNPKLGLKHD